MYSDKLLQSCRECENAVLLYRKDAAYDEKDFRGAGESFPPMAKTFSFMLTNAE